MKKLEIFFKALHIILVALTLLSGIVKVIGVRMEFMRVTQVGFDDWKITFLGFLQILSALLLAFKKTMIVGAVTYSLVYIYVAWHYFANDLHPKFAPILLAVLPIVLIVYKKQFKRY